MIIVKLSGGLGNQMFQLATAFALKKKFGHKRLLVDVDGFNNQIEKKDFTPRNYELEQVFNISLPRYSKSSFTNRFRNIFQKIQYYYEPSPRFHEELLNKKINLYLEGYFQTEKYFANYRSELIDLFQFRKGLSNHGEFHKREIEKSQTPIAVHYRRGDMAKKPEINKIHGVVGAEYYSEAMMEIRKSIENPTFFIFSDDKEYIQELFSNESDVKLVTYEKTGNDWEDMYLMSLCHHFVIANSSFSWWSAWLAQYDNKVIYAPKPWFKDATKESLTMDLIPKQWLRLTNN